MIPAPPMTTESNRPAPLAAVLAVTFAGSVSGGVFWAAIFFVTARQYGFTPTGNLVLAAVMGAVYAVTAAGAGRLVRRLSASSSPRTLLTAALAVWTLAAIAPLVAPHSEAVLWGGALLGAVASAMSWPIVESYLSAGRHGAQMRAAIGWFNVTWTPATALGLLLLPVVTRIGPLSALALSAAGSFAALVATFRLPARPGAHEPEEAQAAVGREYPFLLRAVSWLLPMSYLLCAAMSPLLPHRLAAVSGGTAGGGVAALWMVARFFTLLAMWRFGFWHGRWGTLVLAAGTLAGGLAVVMLAPSVTLLAVGLIVFGVGMGLTYYAALYYSLAVGHAAVDAGGAFEALIGFGYFAGPLLGLGGRALAPPDHGALATVMLTWLVAGACSLGALSRYRAARRARPGASVLAPLQHRPEQRPNLANPEVAGTDR